MSMIKIKLQSEFEAQQGFYYEVDLSGTPFANGKKGNLYIPFTYYIYIFLHI